MYYSKMELSKKCLQFKRSLYCAVGACWCLYVRSVEVCPDVSRAPPLSSYSYHTCVTKGV